MKETLTNVWKWCRRYVTVMSVIVVGFMVYSMFFNESSVKSMEVNNEIERINNAIKQNEDTTAYYNQLLQRLSDDPETMERIVREHYHMQRPNEDVYVFE
ncbi:MAG: septum formation initiator family protein [Muribaculaceae bacterium]|nr:septum formation initiator family protein [Muribaculaceae bacterium]MBQ7852273.1 septum formation initiator family protein [Muribaculaceae bacterium]MBR1963550.1 septum formation initiator family protein [Muribaculaceae bacterium]